MFDALLAYERYLNPESPVIDLFDTAIEEAKSLLQDNKYKASNIYTIIKFFKELTENNEEIIDSFGKVPERLLPTLAITFKEELEGILTQYSDAIRTSIRRYDFSYAESVANKMKVIFGRTDSLSIKVLAMQCTLLASSIMNRFAAMAVFDEMLLSMKSTEEIFFTSEMLREYFDYYSNIADRISPNQLPPSIRLIQDKAINKI